jgi:ribosomal protein L16 Arg81 hydroxylase
MQPANTHRAVAAIEADGETAPFHESVTLQRLVAPISEEEFLARYWEKKPLIIHRENPGYYGDMFTLRDFDEWTVGGRGYVKTAEATAKVQAKHQGAAASALERVLADMRDGHTLILDGVQDFERKLGQVCRRLSVETGARFQTNIYLTPPGGKGFTAHWDNHDVFVMQVMGSKHWKVEKNRRALPGREASMESDREIQGEFYSFTLKEGDVLYMPRGYVHAAECGSEASMHVTMGMYPDTWDQLISAVLKTVVLQDDSLRMALPYGYMKRGEQGMVNRIAEVMRKAANPEFLAQVVEQFRDEIVQKAPLDISGSVASSFRAEPVALDERVRARPALFYRTTPHPEAVTLKVGTRAITFPDFFAPALEFALNTAEFTVRDLPGELEDEERIAFVERLVQEGLIIRD